jgi:hypothetical protein
MNKQDYLVNIVGEEGCEVGQRACKATRFGIFETQDGHTENNWDRLIGEVNDLLGTLELCAEEGLDTSKLGDRIAIDRKKANVKKYMQRSREHGKLED